jgi:hypothetical protein
MRFVLVVMAGLAMTLTAAGCGGGTSGTSGTAAVTTTTGSTTTPATTTRTAPTPTTMPWPPPGLTSGTPILRTPSGNIECTLDPSEGFGVVCNAIKHDWTLPPKPASCEFEWTDAVFLEPTGRPQFWCSSNAAIYTGEAWPRFDFPYGATVTGSGIRCTSRVSGVSCTNRDKHGFFLSRQRVTFSSGAASGNPGTP